MVLFIRTPNDLDKIGKYRTDLVLAGPDSRVIITLLSFSAEVMNLHFTKLWEKCIDTVQFNASKTPEREDETPMEPPTALLPSGR